LTNNNAQNNLQEILAHLPPRDPKSDAAIYSLMIEESVGLLRYLLDAIRKWECVVWEEFHIFERQAKKEYPDGFLDYYDPLTDEAFIRHHTGLALYGSLAVAISAKVEDDIAWLFHVWGVNALPGKKGAGKKSKRPHFDDYLHEIEVRCKCKRESLLHHQDHLFVRELANRFKHSGGKSTKDFVARFGTVAGMTEDDRDIPFDRYCWECYITQAKEYLLDILRRLCEKAVDEAKGETLSKRNGDTP